MLQKDALHIRANANRVMCNYILSVSFGYFFTYVAYNDRKSKGAFFFIPRHLTMILGLSEFRPKKLNFNWFDCQKGFLVAGNEYPKTVVHSAFATTVWCIPDINFGSLTGIRCLFLHHNNSKRLSFNWFLLSYFKLYALRCYSFL